MSRPRIRLLILGTFLTLCSLVAAWIPTASDPLGLVLTTLFLGMVWQCRTWFKARFAHRRGELPRAIEGYRHFLLELQSRPLLSRLGWSLYTSDMTCLTLNNIGVCYLGTPDGREQARAAFQQALLRDPGYALPHLNLGLLAHLEGDMPGSRAHFAEAFRNGYSERGVQRAVMRAAARVNAAIGRH